MKITVVEGPVLPNTGTQTAVGTMTVEQLIDIYQVDQYDPEIGSPGEEGGYQRLAKENRVKELASKIGKKGLVVANAILINVRPEDAVPKKLLFDVNGTVSVNLPKKVWIEDGQHRVEAWKRVFLNPEDYGISKKEIAETKICFVMYWGSAIEEEVNTFFDTNNFSKGLELENRLELDIYLSKIADGHTHPENKDLINADLVVKELETHPIWNGKIRKPNSKTGIVPRSALLQSIIALFKSESLFDMELEDRKKLVISVWEAVAEVFPEIFEDPRAKDWSLQKAIGVNTIHKLVPYICGNIFKRRGTPGAKNSDLDPLSKETYVEYFSKMKSVKDSDPKLMDGLSFWRAGKEGGAGAYSSGQGKKMLLDIYIHAILGIEPS